MGAIVWSQYNARFGIGKLLRELGLDFSDLRYTAGDKKHGDPNWILTTATDGIKLSPYKNTWQRKRSSGYLICIEYVWQGKVIYKRVEPWVSYPSDILITQLTLLPREVK